MRAWDALGEALVPGAEQAGITNFIDQQISTAPEEALLRASSPLRRSMSAGGLPAHALGAV
jgi:hypothetical protein